MDFRAFDRARRQAGPLELDLVESYAKGSVTRREFVRRGALIGLSLPSELGVHFSARPGAMSLSPRVVRYSKHWAMMP